MAQRDSLMESMEVFIPQMGEGLQEVRIIAFLKKPGDTVRRDEVIYSMETDKSVMEVESPYEGVLQEWLAKEDQILPIGAPIARIGNAPGNGHRSEAMREITGVSAVQDHTLPSAAAGLQDSSEGAGTASMPTLPVTRSEEPVTDIRIVPRTRLYCRKLGISEEEMRGIRPAGTKLMPEDIDRYLAARPAVAPAHAEEDALADTRHVPAGRAESQEPQTRVVSGYREQPLTPQQRIFASRIRRSAQTVVPGTIMRPMEWAGLRSITESIRRSAPLLRTQEPAFRPSEFQTFAYCVAQAVRSHPKFRSTLIGDDMIREYDHVNLGIAVARENGDLVTAVVAAADALDYTGFVQTAQSRIRLARDGQDQASAETQLLLTYMGAFEILDAVPVLVAPAVAVLFIGACYTQGDSLLVNLALTFDHRLINGVDAAQFLNAIIEQTAKFTE